MMKMLLCALGVGALLTACGDTQSNGAQKIASDRVSAATVVSRPETHSDPLTTEEKQFYRDVARSSWEYIQSNYQESTGLVNASPGWANTTLWDLGSQLMAFVAAKQLGLIEPAEFSRRVTTTLTTLEHVPLYRDAAFNKQYSTTNGAISTERLGWSATDIGRFLVALKVLALQEPAFAAQAERIARRNDFRQIAPDGYLHGQMPGARGKPWTFQEGRIGYEQYVARGFQFWGADVRNALDLKRNSESVSVLGVPLLADHRGQDRLVSEPFVLYGLELGLTGDMRDLAVNVLKAQEERYRSTGTVTIASEDAVSVPPEYFYYYCVYCSGKPFVIDASTPGKLRSSPRWVSTKAAFGWNALMPSDYTKLAFDYVAAAKDPRRGWASGVYEGTKASTKSFDINTAAVMLEVALYRLRGDRPLIEPGPLAP